MAEFLLMAQCVFAAVLVIVLVVGITVLSGCAKPSPKRAMSQDGVTDAELQRESDRALDMKKP